MDPPTAPNKRLDKRERVEATSDAMAALERFPAKWIPVRVRKTRHITNPEPRSDSNGTEKALVQSDPAKVEVMGYCRKLVADGFAEWQTLDDGTIRLWLITGETYLLEKATITRIA